MAKLSSYRRIITNDFEEEEQPLVEQLSVSLNQAFNQVYYALNGRISLVDNIQCTVAALNIIVDSTGKPTSQTSFKLTGGADYSIIGCQVIRAENQTNPAIYPTGQPFISFTQNSGSLYINNITSLQANQRYSILVVAYG